MSINDLVKEEVQRQIDAAIESIPYDKSRMSTPIAKSRFQYKEISDFLLGFEYGHITGICAWYYKDLVVQSGREVAKEEERQVGLEISAISLACFCPFSLEPWSNQQDVYEPKWRIFSSCYGR